MTPVDAVEAVAEAVHEAVDALADALTADPATAELAADALAGLGDVWGYARQRLGPLVVRGMAQGTPAMLRALTQWGGRG